MRIFVLTATYELHVSGKSHLRDHPNVVSPPLHFNENPVYVFQEREVRGLSPNFHIHVSVSDLYTVLPGSVCLLLQGNMRTDPGNT